MRVFQGHFRSMCDKFHFHLSETPPSFSLNLCKYIKKKYMYLGEHSVMVKRMSFLFCFHFIFPYMSYVWKNKVKKIEMK